MLMYYGCYQDVVAQGTSHLDMFVRDYYNFISKLNAPISLDAFAEEWRCIPTGMFQRLKINDEIYIKNIRDGFIKLRVVAYPTYDAAEELAVIEAQIITPDDDTDDTNILVYNCGDVYLSDSTTAHTPQEYRLIHPEQFSKGGTNSWPIKVITTKTKAQ